MKVEFEGAISCAGSELVVLYCVRKCFQERKSPRLYTRKAFLAPEKGNRSMH